MLEAAGDIWVHRIKTKVITTNGYTRKDGCAVMGRGVARQAKERYPHIPYDLGQMLAKYGNQVYYFPHYHIITFPVKHNWWEVADLNLILGSCLELKTGLDQFQIPEVVMVRPGCGNGQLDWATVRPLIAPLLDDRVTIIQE